MKARALAAVTLLGFAGSSFGQEQSIFSRPSQAFKKLYYKLSTGNHKTGVDVRSYDLCPKCNDMHDPDGECIERVPVDDCVVGKKKLFEPFICYEYVTIAEVRYRWKTKWVEKEIPADCQEPIVKSDETVEPAEVQDWESFDNCNRKLYCNKLKCDPDATDIKHIECQPGTTTIKVKYKSLVKEPYTVYRQIKRPIAVKKPCTEDVQVPIRRYEGNRVKKDCD